LRITLFLASSVNLLIFLRVRDSTSGCTEDFDIKCVYLLYYKQFRMMLRGVCFILCILDKIAFAQKLVEILFILKGNVKDLEQENFTFISMRPSHNNKS